MTAFKSGSLMMLAMHPDESVVYTTGESGELVEWCLYGGLPHMPKEHKVRDPKSGDIVQIPFTAMSM